MKFMVLLLVAITIILLIAATINQEVERLTAPVVPLPFLPGWAQTPYPPVLPRRERCLNANDLYARDVRTAFKEDSDWCTGIIYNDHGLTAIVGWAVDNRGWKGRNWTLKDVLPMYPSYAFKEEGK